MFEKLKLYSSLIRLNKPIGILLLLWPTLWALMLAKADWNIILIFVAGVFLMRSAGCIVNDIADRHWDGFVTRTRGRPLASKKISVKEAWILFFLLISLAFILVLQCNGLTIVLAFFGLVFAMVYPLLKRITHLPQLGLGIAFSWGIPMVFAATEKNIPWLLFAAAALWPVIYDTFYAMVDKEDDIKVGIKSTAIAWGKYDKKIIAVLQASFILLMIMVGQRFGLSQYYFISLLGVALLFCYQQGLIKNKKYFQAFLNNNAVGFIIFLGILL